MNEYGLTETTITCCAEINITQKNLNCIGKPINNCDIQIIDEFNNLLPAGKIGEITVSGECLSKGYLNNPKFNQVKFITLSENQDVVSFKTGDIGYIDENGKVYFVGRKEENRKINGIRCSLTEIEYIIQSMQGVSDAAAVIYQKERLEKIILFVIGTKDISVEDLELKVKQKLYLQSIPLVIIKTDHIPITDSGKKDTKLLLLRYIDQITNSIEVDLIEHRDEYEIEIEKLWCKLLEVDKVENNKSFFEVGGNSLLLMEMFKSLEEKYGEQVKLVDLFNYPTIKTFSEYLRSVIKAAQI